MSDPFKTPGAFSWQELITDDVARAREFYTELFGWSAEEMNITDTPYTVLKLGETPVGGIMARPDQMPADVPSHWGAYVTVEDIDATVARAEALGGGTLVPVTEIPGVGRFALLRDPGGAALAAIEYALACDEG